MSTRQPPRGKLGLAHSSYWIERPDLDAALEEHVRKSVDEDARAREESLLAVQQNKEQGRRRLQLRRLQREAVEFVSGKRKEVGEDVLQFIREGGLEESIQQRKKPKDSVFDGPVEAEPSLGASAREQDVEDAEMRDFVSQLHREAMLQSLEERRMRREELELSIRTPFTMQKIKKEAEQRRSAQLSGVDSDGERMLDELKSFEDKVHRQVKKNHQEWKEDVKDVKKRRKFK